MMERLLVLYRSATRSVQFSKAFVLDDLLVGLYLRFQFCGQLLEPFQELVVAKVMPREGHGVGVER
jgi:hypothetical protein